MRVRFPDHSLEGKYLRLLTWLLCFVIVSWFGLIVLSIEFLHFLPQVVAVLLLLQVVRLVIHR